jgi:hypothetical protein
MTAAASLAGWLVMACAFLCGAPGPFLFFSFLF